MLGQHQAIRPDKTFNPRPRMRPRRKEGGKPNRPVEPVLRHEEIGADGGKRHRGEVVLVCAQDNQKTSRLLVYRLE